MNALHLIVVVLVLLPRGLPGLQGISIMSGLSWE